MIKITEDFIEESSQKAKTSPRKRMNFNFHKHDSDRLQRMLNALEMETYIQPHKHQDPDKVEAFFALRGRILVVEFDAEGKITDHIILDAKKGNYGTEIAARTWHTIICLEPGSVAYEVKDGPYNVAVDKNFAPWAPAEGDPSCTLYLHKILKELGLE
jgi:cupin fold WbuC family metalloprotein